MSRPPLVAVRSDHWYDPIMAERFARAPGIELRAVGLRQPEAAA